MHTIVSVEKSDASEPGALGGFMATCSCGHVNGSSLSAHHCREAAWDHARFMNRKEAK